MFDLLKPMNVKFLVIFEGPSVLRLFVVRLASSRASLAKSIRGSVFLLLLEWGSGLELVGSTSQSRGGLGVGSG